jgi:hypothetical protein
MKNARAYDLVGNAKNTTKTGERIEIEGKGKGGEERKRVHSSSPKRLHKEVKKSSQGGKRSLILERI